MFDQRLLHRTARLTLIWIQLWSELELILINFQFMVSMQLNILSRSIATALSLTITIAEIIHLSFGTKQQFYQGKLSTRITTKFLLLILRKRNQRPWRALFVLLAFRRTIAKQMLGRINNFFAMDDQQERLLRLSSFLF